ncbi:hypothetical protein [Mycobacterium marinum]|uniref:hypothetical protein n=1 Tax=Mycobacterium marinum TaxID=1781 RepID=UPI003562FAAD
MDATLFTVTNPQGSVSVSAAMGGDIHRIEPSDKVDNMSEPRLAEEIFVLAGPGPAEGAGRAAHLHAPRRG